MPVKGLIFDVDGTLAETEEIHRKAFNDTFRALELDRQWPDPDRRWIWDVDMYGRLLKVTGGKERIAHYLKAELGIDATAAYSTITDIHAAKTRRFSELIATGDLTLRPGIAAVIERARALGMRLGIATTTSRPNLDAICRAGFDTMADQIFAGIAAGDDVAAKKPAPDVYVLALQRMGLAAHEAIALEDSRNGVLAARAASIRCIACPSHYSRGEDFADADHRIDSFEAAMPILFGTSPDQSRASINR